MTTSEAIVARARGCIGARFRAQGRDPAFGLDCVGVAAIALGRAAPADYALRSAGPATVRAGALAAGLAPIMVADAAAGDLALLASAPTQLHLAILTPAGFVHADLGLRRVVETPGRPANIIGAWRAGG